MSGGVRPRLLQLIPTHGRGGCEEYALTVAREAARRGWQVTAAFPDTPATATLAADYRRTAIDWRGAGLTVPGWSNAVGTRTVAALAARTARLLVATRPTVVQLVLPWPVWGLGPMIACAALARPTAVVFQLAASPPVVDRWAGLGHRLALARGHQWVAVSEQNRRSLAEGFRLTPDRIRVIPNGADPRPPADPTERAGTRRGLGVSADQTLVLGVGRLHEQKGFDLLLDAARWLAHEYPGVRVVVAGDGPQREALERSIREHGLETTVRLLGHRTDVPKLLAAADLFAFPSRSEGHPFALCEAMAAGLPVVAAAVGGAEDMVEDGVNGWRFEPGEAAGFRRGLTAAMTSRTRWAVIGDRGRQTAARFSAAGMLDRTIALLARLSARTRAAD